MPASGAVPGACLLTSHESYKASCFRYERSQVQPWGLCGNLQAKPPLSLGITVPFPLSLFLLSGRSVFCASTLGDCGTCTSVVVTLLQAIPVVVLPHVGVRLSPTH